MKFIAEKVSLMRWGAHYDGWLFTLLRIVVKASAILGTSGTRAEWFQQLAEQRFDKRFGVETGGLMQPEDMQIPTDRIAHAVEYAPTSASRFGWLLSQLPVNLSEFVFIDFGSGKGRVLLMASEFPFQKVVGVELGRELHETAVENIQRFRSHKRQCQDVQSLNQDATQFQFPANPLVLYFFNPFSAEIFRQLLNNLRASLKEHPRQVIALYYNPLFAEVFEEDPLFTTPHFKINPGPGWRIYTTR